MKDANCRNLCSGRINKYTEILKANQVPFYTGCQVKYFDEEKWSYLPSLDGGVIKLHLMFLDQKFECGVVHDANHLWVNHIGVERQSEPRDSFMGFEKDLSSKYIDKLVVIVDGCSSRTVAKNSCFKPQDCSLFLS